MSTPNAGPTRSASARVAVVTGANRGLGLEVGRQLAESGLRVILTSRVQPFEDAEHRRLDVADTASVRALADALSADCVDLDVLVNNARIALRGFDAEVARRTLEVNFFGALRVTDALLPRIRDGGTIVMVSSGMGEVSALAPRLRERILSPALTRDELVESVHSFVRDVERGRHEDAGWPSSAYRVSKVVLNALTRVLARELAPRRIRVNAVCPGWVRTDMGGSGASRSVEVGARSIVWAAALDQGPTGGFFRDGRAIGW
jgi:NAD(P)-dependent dehydrogenase (short-subunit alcohol dehydrogenase family)